MNKSAWRNRLTRGLKTAMKWNIWIDRISSEVGQLIPDYLIFLDLYVYEARVDLSSKDWKSSFLLFVIAIQLRPAISASATLAPLRKRVDRSMWLKLAKYFIKIYPAAAQMPFQISYVGLGLRNVDVSYDFGSLLTHAAIFSFCVKILSFPSNIESPLTNGSSYRHLPHSFHQSTMPNVAAQDGELNTTSRLTPILPWVLVCIPVLLAVSIYHVKSLDHLYFHGELLYRKGRQTPTYSNNDHVVHSISECEFFRKDVHYTLWSIREWYRVTPVLLELSFTKTNHQTAR